MEAKKLEVQNILKSTTFRRRNPGSTDEIYQADRHGHLPKAEEEVLTHYPIGLSISVSDQR
jgi:hypothetical protein